MELGDGELHRDDFISNVKLVLGLSDSDCRRLDLEGIFEAMDIDASGFIRMQDFVSVLMAQREATPEEKADLDQIMKEAQDLERHCIHWKADGGVEVEHSTLCSPLGAKGAPQLDSGGDVTLVSQCEQQANLSHEHNAEPYMPARPPPAVVPVPTAPDVGLEVSPLMIPGEVCP